MRIISIYSIDNGLKIGLIALIILLGVSFGCWFAYTLMEDCSIRMKIISAVLFSISIAGLFVVGLLIPDKLQDKYGYYVEITDEDDKNILNDYNIIETHGNLYVIEDK